MKKFIEIITYFMPDGIMKLSPAAACVPVDKERWENEGGRVFTAIPWTLYPVFYK